MHCIFYALGKSIFSMADKRREEKKYANTANFIYTRIV